MNQYGSKAVVLHKHHLEEFLKKCAERDEFLELLKRTKAEFIDYQNRTKKEKEEIYKFAITNFLKDFSKILEYFTAARKIASNDLPLEKIKEGYELVEKEAIRILSNYGVKIFGERGDKFDPTIHEAVEIIQKNDCEEMTIIDIIRPGIMLYDKVISPARVKVAVKNTDQSSQI